MGVNHVTTADGEELINLMSDTVDEYSLLEGATAHDASGEQIRGKAVYVNPNILINPDFSINQRGISGTVTKTGYFLDGWQLVSGFATINDDGSITLNGTIKQTLETPAGDKVIATSSSGTPLYDDSTKTFSLTASDEKITWTKLEPGSVATPFVPPNYATELVKCQRYLYVPNRMQNKYAYYAFGYAITTNQINFIMPIPNMRINPTLIILNGDISSFQALRASGVRLTITDIAIGDIRRNSNNMIHFTVTVSDTLTIGETVVLCNYNTGASLALSAELS